MSKLVLTGNSPVVRARQRVEQTIALATAKALLDAGFLLGVNDGEETTLWHSRDLEAVQKALFTTDEDWLLVYEDRYQDRLPTVWDGSAREPKQQGDKRGDYFVRFVYGNDGWDVISDYSVSLDPYIGEGTTVNTLVDKLSEDYDPALLLA